MSEDEKNRLKAYLSKLPAVDRLAARSSSVPPPIDSWMWGLSAWGQPTLIRACYSLADEAFPKWLEFQESATWLGVSSQRVPICFAELQAWLETKDNLHLNNIKNHQAEIKEFRYEMDFSLYEGEKPEEVYYAGLVCAYTLLVASWTSEDINIIEGESDGEVNARLKAGPAFEATQAVYYAKRAFGWTDEEIRKRIADALMT
jgi:hypothetical protein